MVVFSIFLLGFSGWVLGLAQPLLFLAITFVAAVVDVKFPRVWRDKPLVASPLLLAYFLGVGGAMLLAHSSFFLSPVIGFGLGYALSRIIKSSKPH
jgi:hypothetical protein